MHKQCFKKQNIFWQFHLPPNHHQRFYKTLKNTNNFQDISGVNKYKNCFQNPATSCTEHFTFSDVWIVCACALNEKIKEKQKTKKCWHNYFKQSNYHRLFHAKYNMNSWWQFPPPSGRGCCCIYSHYIFQITAMAFSPEITFGFFFVVFLCCLDMYFLFQNIS